MSLLAFESDIRGAGGVVWIFEAIRDDGLPMRPNYYIFTYIKVGYDYKCTLVLYWMFKYILLCIS